MKDRAPICSWAALLGAALMLAASHAGAANRFEVSIGPKVASGPVTGRLLVAVSTDAEHEPRQKIGLRGAALFGEDVHQVRPGKSMTVDASAIGYPMPNLAALPAGDYYVQAILVTYRHLTRSDGHTIWVPVPHRRVFAAAKAGNLVSGVRKVHLDPADDGAVRLVLNHTIPKRPELKDTQWIKHVRIHSDILSKFWGYDVTIGADVLLPKGYATHPNARYPVVFPFGHGDRPFSFNSDPMSNSARRWAINHDTNNLKTGYEFYQEWVSNHFPRMVAITFETPFPYFVESYAVNSANNGPWGTAFTEEIIPWLESHFRIIGKPYARIVEGASTGGWEALALQLYYPDYFGGAWVFNPDPISFRHYQLVNIYKDDNMFSVPINQWISRERPFRRSHEGQPIGTMRQLARFEAVLGSHGRSGYQLDIWQSTHGPVGKDGYPVPLFDKLTGKIDHDVANYYREHGYDLTAYVAGHWKTLGPKLRGKLHFFSGEMDDFFLNLGVYDFQRMIRRHAPANYPISFSYGRPEKGHGWHLKDWASTVRDMAAYISDIAPPGADLAQWNY